MCCGHTHRVCTLKAHFTLVRSLTQVGGFPVGLSASSWEASDAETSVAESTDGETEENGGHGE